MPNVISSNLDFVEYDSTYCELFITFKSGSKYVYFNVPESVYCDLLNAPSKGKYFNKNIKPFYRYQRRGW